MVLLVGAGLLDPQFDKLSNVQLGYRPDRLLVMNTNLPGKDLADARRSNAPSTARWREGSPNCPAWSLRQRRHGTFAGAPTRSDGGYYLEGGPSWEQMGTQSPQADFLVIAPEYFKTIGVPFLRGRDFSERDGYDSEFTVIVNEALVKQSFPGQDPIGRRVQCGMDTEKLMTIVGVVADFHTADPALPPRPALYTSYPGSTRFMDPEVFSWARTHGGKPHECRRSCAPGREPGQPRSTGPVHHHGHAALRYGGLSAISRRSARLLRRACGTCWPWRASTA